MDAIAQLSDLLDLGREPVRFATGIQAQDEPFELGVALPLVADSRPFPAVQIYYNPRHRSEHFRGRVLEVLSDWGLDARTCAEAFRLVPCESGSTVLGLEWRPGESQPAATLYLEEVSCGRAGTSHEAALGELVGLAGLREAPTDGAVGVPYIWAFDISSREPPRFKSYRRADGGDRDRVRQELEGYVGGPLAAPIAARLFEGALSAGFILQNRFDEYGHPLIHKVYRCFPYEDAGHDAAAANLHAAQTLRALGAGRRSLRSARIFCDQPPWCSLTSLALAFEPGQPAPVYGTGYWCLLRN